MNAERIAVTQAEERRRGNWLGKGTTSVACGKMLWKTIDAKVAARSDDVGDCETPCSLKFPASANFAANFSRMKPENLKLCPKSAKLAPHSGNLSGIPGNFALTLRPD